MPAPIRELLHFASPFVIQVEGEGDGKSIDRLVLKGFASVETDDRSGDRTDPLEFNIDEFMAAPTLLINHKFWIDPMGNAVAIGRPLSMNAAKLARIDGNDTEWSIVDLKTRKQINTFLKEKVPSLKKGDRGLFVTAEVTQEEVRGQIARGELGGMSWRGLVVVEYELDPKTNMTVRVLRDIDLYEISVTHIPEHNQSTFVVGKMVDGKFEEVGGIDSQDVQLWQVRLEKSKFASLGMATEYLKAHKLESGAIREEEHSFFAEQLPAARFQLEKTVRMKMGDVYMIMAPPKEPPKPTLGTSQLVAELVGVAQKDNSEEVTKMADEKEVQADAMATDTGDVKDDVAKAAEEKEKAFKAFQKKQAADEKEKEEEMKKKEAKKSVADKQLDALGDHVAGSVANALKPALEGIAGGMTSMGAGLKTLTETIAKMAVGVSTEKETDTNTETKKEVAKGAIDADEVLGEVMDKLNGLTTELADQQDQIVEVAKSAIALGESIPNKGIEREENVEVEKSAKDDPNSCFDSAFAFFDR